MTANTTLTSKGQITIPKEIRDNLGMKPGDRINFTLMPDGTVRLRAKSKSVLKLGGGLRRKGRNPISTDKLLP